MCGIAGFFHKSLSFDESKMKITSMIENIEHRGPDATNVVISKFFSSATARLAIEKIKEGKQPIISESKKYILSFNGEIFNYKDIINKYSFQSKNVNSEIKLLENLFEIKGTSFVNELEGQFAISIYDLQKQVLYLFRDRFGIRPLFYQINKKSFIYASEIKSISAFSKEIFNTNIKSIASTSLFWSNINKSTSFEKIYQLQPGHYLTYKNGNLEINKYWENPILLNNDYNYNRDFSQILQDALKRQIHGEVGFSSYLSGGIDSSAIAYLLTKIQNSPIDTFSIQFENKEYDETDAQNKIQKVINSNHYALKISDQDIVENFERVINHSEAHLFRTAPVPMYLLSKKVKEVGHKVVFTGEGADEVLLGYDIYGELKIRQFWSKFPDSKIRPQLLQKLYYYLPQFKNKRYFQITKEFYRKNLKDLSNIFYSHQVRWNQYNVIKNFFNLDQDDFSREKLEKELLENFNKRFNKLEVIKRAQLIEIDTLLSGYLLSSQGDRMTMAHGVEGRYPYLDDKLNLELASISPQSKAPGLKLKNILRKSFKGILPNEIVNRPKFAYQAPEAKVFFNNKKGLTIVNEFIDGLSNNEKLNKDSFINLISKFKNPDISSRLGFRENMAFIIGLSDHFLKKVSANWLANNNSNRKKINYEYFN